MRVWVYQTLKASDLWDEVDERVFQTSLMTKVPDKLPYVYYRMGMSRSALQSASSAQLTPFTVYAYDKPGDYMRIDGLLEIAKQALVLVPPLVYDPRLIQCSWSDTSEDVPQDPLTGTIAKAARFSLAHT